MKVKVTKQDIKRGVKGDSCNCPIARAIKRSSHRKVTVGIATTYVAGKAYPMPREARIFVGQFDRGERTKPITFTMKPERT